MSENSNQPWSEGAVAGLAIATFFIPLVGIIAGLAAMQNPASKGQGGGLLVWGILTGIGWLMALSQ